MCREIIEAHHGRIRVDSTVGKGTAFTLKLPTVSKAAAARPADRDPQAGARQPVHTAPRARRSDLSNLGRPHRSHGRPLAVWGLSLWISVQRDGRSLGREAVEDLAEDPLLGDRVATLGNPLLH